MIHQSGKNLKSSTCDSKRTPTPSTLWIWFTWEARAKMIIIIACNLARRWNQSNKHQFYITTYEGKILSSISAGRIPSMDVLWIRTRWKMRHKATTIRPIFNSTIQEGPGILNQISQIDRLLDQMRELRLFITTFNLDLINLRHHSREEILTMRELTQLFKTYSPLFQSRRWKSRRLDNDW